MKPTQKQKELIKTIEKIVSSWASTNDITSPTHYGDISEELRKFIIQTSTPEEMEILSQIEYMLGNILMEIKRYDRENKETE